LQAEFLELRLAPSATYLGNGNTGFGGPIGGGSLTLSDDGVTVSGNLTKGPNGFNDALVLYLQTGSGGFSNTTGFSDAADGLRRAISGFDGGSNHSVMNFTGGFAPNYAIALGPADDNFGGLWQLQNGGNGSLPFISSVNLTPTGTNNADTYSFSFNLAQVGLSPHSGASFQIFGSYISNTGFRSNEALPGNDMGTAGWNPFTETSAVTYATTPPVTITTASLPNWTAGASYSQTLGATGGSGSITFATTTGTLPTGLTLTTAGVLSGTPTTVGTYSFAISASDATGFSASKSYTVTINPGVSLTTTSLADATNDQPLSQTIAAAGGTGSKIFAVTGGDLPGGVTLSSDGVLAGTPGIAGTYTFEVTASDQVGARASFHYSWTIVSAPTLSYEGRAFVAGHYAIDLDGVNVRLVDSDASAVLLSQPLAGTNSIKITGNSVGGNTLSLDFSHGAVTLAGGITFDAVSGGSLIIDGGGTSGSYTPSTAHGAGAVSIDGTTISFQNLSPVEVSNVSSWTVNTPATDDNLTVSNSTAPSNSSQAAVKVSGASDFEAVYLYNVGTLTVDTPAASDDTVEIAGVNFAAASVANFTLNTGSDGTDAVTLDTGATTLGGTFQLLTSASSTVHLGQAVSAGTITGNAATVDVAAPGQIQVGVDLAVSGGTVNVAEGTYRENLRINHPVTLDGAGSSHTIVQPAVSDVTQALVFVQADNVTIEGFTLEGNNPSISSGQTTGVIDTDAGYGVLVDTSTAHTGLVVAGNTVQDIYKRGVMADMVGGGTYNIHDNLVINIAGTEAGVGIFGREGSGFITNNYVDTKWDGIATNYSHGTQISGNTVVHAATFGFTDGNGAIHSDNYGGAGISGPELIENNTVASGGVESVGIWAFFPYGTVTIQGNMISGVDIGLAAFGGTATGLASFLNNTVGTTATSFDGGANAEQYGAYVTTDTLGFGDFSVSASLTGNQLTGNQYGLRTAEPGAPAATLKVSAAGNTMASNAVAGIEVSGGSTTLSGNYLYDNGTGILLTNGGTASIDSNDFTGATSNGTDLHLDASAGLLTGSFGGNQFAALTTYIDNGSTQNLDATGDTFNVGGGGSQVGGSALTLAEAFVVEDRISDYLDNPARGYVSIQDGNVFVTQLSEQTTAGAIQRGVNVGPGGGCIEVQAGRFIGEVVIDKPLHVEGAQAGVDPNSAAPPASAQTIIQPDVADATSTLLVTIQSSDVTLDGVTVDGNNPDLPANANTIEANGKIIGAAIGIIGDEVYDRLRIQNNVIENISVFGIYLDAESGSSTGAVIAHNQIDNLPDPTFGGTGILLADNVYGTVSDNVLTRTWDGIVLNHYGDVGSGTISVSGNQVASSDSGIYLLDAYAGLGQVAITGNTMTAVAGSTSNRGLSLEGVNAGAAVTVSGNDVTGGHVGVFLWGNPGGVTVSGGTLSGNDYGVLASDFDQRIFDLTGSAASSSAGTDSSGTLDEVTVTGAAQVGVLVIDDLSSTPRQSVRLTVKDSTGLSSSPIAIEVSGPHASLDFSGSAAAALSGVSTSYIVLTDGAMGGSAPSALDATQVTFDGLGGSNAATTLDQFFHIEDLVTDYLDDPSVGYVALRANRIYVVNSGESPVSGTVSRGIVVANNGDTLFVQPGTYAGDVNVDKAITVITGNPTTLHGSLTLSAAGATLALQTDPAQFFATNFTAGAGTFTDFTLDNSTTPGTGYDQIVASGTVTIDPAASINLSETPGFVPAAGSVFRLIDNTGSSAISGTFANLADGSTVYLNGLPYLVNYEGGTGNDLTLTLESPATVYVGNNTAADFTITNDVAPAGLSAGDTVTWNPSGAQHSAGTVSGLIFGYNAFTNIQDGINAVAGGGTVDVETGTYAENLVLSKTVTLSGAGQGKALVVPATSNVGTPGGQGSEITTAGNLVLVQADYVTIHGFTFDGNNPSLSSGVTVGGVDIDARNGIITNHTLGVFNNLTVYNTTVQNVFERGIYASSGGTFNFHDDTVSNVQGNGGSIAIFNFAGSGIIQHNTVDQANDAISANHSTGTQFLDNIITHSGSGVHTDNNGDSGGVADVIRGNRVSLGAANSYGIFVFVPYVTVTVDSNTISGVDIGLAAFGGGGGSANFTNNTVSAGSDDALVSNDQPGFDTGSVSASFTGNTLTGGQVGLYVEQISDSSTPGTTTTVTATGNTSSDASTAGVQMTGGTLSLSQNIIQHNGIGVLVQGGTLVSATQNLISDNTGDGFQVGGQTGNGIFSEPYAVTVTTTGVVGSIFNNDLSGNGGLGVDNLTGTLVDASGNWWGSNTQAGVQAAVSSNVDYTPWLNSGASSAVIGFQGDFSYLHVSAASPQSGSVGRTQEGINDVTAGGTVFLHDGTYAESNITVPVSVTIQGESESGVVITPDATDSHDNGTYAGTAVQGFLIEASHVDVDHLTIDGGAGQNYRQGILADSSNGWSGVNSGTLTVDHVTIENVFRKGIALYSRSGLTTGNVITNNTLDAIGTSSVNPFESAFAIADFSSSGTISNNVISNAAIGIGANYLSGNPAHGPALTITGNQISTPATGTGNPAVGMDLSGLANGSVVSGNTLDLTGGSGHDVALVLQYSAPGADVSVHDNGITLDSGDTGLYLYQTSDAAHPALVDHNTISGSSAATGILVTDDGSLLGESPHAGTTYAALTRNTISGVLVGINVTATGGLANATIGSSAVADANTITTNTSDGIGIDVSGAGASATVENANVVKGCWIGLDASGSATIKGNHIFGNVTGILLTGGGMASIDSNDFTGGTSNTTDLRLDSSAGLLTGSFASNQFAAATTYIDNRSVQNLDATGDTFNVGSGGAQVGGAGLTLAEAFAVEDKITDAIDASGLGFVRIQGGNVFVTPNSYLAPAANDAGAVQRAVNAASSGDTVYVEGGLYLDNVTIGKALSVRGANAGLAGSSGSRATESEIRTNGNQANIITVAHSGVTLDGLYLEGDDPAVTGGALFSGADANALYAVRANTSISGVTVENSIVKDVFIGFRGDGLSSGNLITSDWFDSIGNYDFGYAVTLRTDYYADVTNNLITRVWTGVHTNNFHTAGGPATWTISGNEIHSYAAGLLYWLQYGSATHLTFNSNHLFAEAGAVANNFGVLIVTLQNTDTLAFTNNTITGTDYGVGLTNVSTSNIVTLDGSNSVTGTKLAGVYLTDNLTFNPVGTTDLTTNAYTGAANAIAVTVSGMTIHAASGVGVKAETSRTMASDVSTTATIDNNTSITTAGAGTGILVIGASASTYVHDNLSTITGNVIGIDINGGSATVTSNTIMANGIGIRVTNGGTLSSATLNAITNNNADGILVTASAGAVGTIMCNDFTGDGPYGVENLSATRVIARQNSWGSPSGPTSPDNPLGAGVPVSSNVAFSPFATNVACTTFADPAVTAASGSTSAAENAPATNSGRYGDYHDGDFVTGPGVTDNGNGTWSWTGTGDEDHPYTMSVTAHHLDGTTTSTTFNVSFTEVAPTFVSQAHNAIVTTQGVPATNSGVFSEYDDPPLTITASQGTLTDHGDGTWDWSQNGTPADSGTVTVTAKNADGSTTSTTFTVTFNAPVAITTTTLADWTVDQPGYSQTISATGGTGSKTFATTAGTLPTGLTLSAAGVLSGTPTAAGSYTFTVTATDTVGASDNHSYTVTINPAVMITTPNLPDGTLTVFYSQTISATGGTGSKTFATTAGTLPSGLTLSSAGVLSGTPTALGTYHFTVTATDTVGAGGSQAYSVTIYPKATKLVLMAPASAAAGTPFNLTITAEDDGGDFAGAYSGTVTLSSSAGPDIAPTSVLVTHGTVTVMATLTTAGTQTVTASASGLTSGTASIVVNPGPFTQYLVTVQGSSTVQAGTTFPVTVQAADAYGNPVTSGYSGPSSVTASITPPSAFSNFPQPVPINGIGGGSFNGILDKVGTYTISVTGGSFTGSTTTPVTVIPGPADLLVYDVQPVSTPTGDALPPVTLEIQDQFGNQLTSDSSDSVSMTVGSGPGGFAAGSTTTVMAHNGVVTFTNLVLVVPGSYTLHAELPSVPTFANSDSFTIAPLQVVPGSVVTSPSGFSLSFNGPYLVNSLTPAIYGPGFDHNFALPATVTPTVTLTQLTGTPPTGFMLPYQVRGSVVLDQGTHRLTFIATNTSSLVDSGTPILADGNYQIDITSSGANGLQAFYPGGGYLDGLYTGVPGSGDYAATFTVSANAAGADIVWAPPTAEGPGQLLNAPGNNQAGGGYPVYLSDATGTVTSVAATLTYDPALLHLTSGAGSPGLTVTVTTPGTATLTYSGPALATGTATPIGYIGWTGPEPQARVVPGGTLAGGTYYYVVTAVDGASESLAGLESLPATTAGSSSTIILTWPQGVLATGYKVYRSTTSGSGYSLLATLGASTLTFTDDGSHGLTPGGPPTTGSTAQVPSGTIANPVPYKSKDLLHLSGVSLNGGSIPVVTSDGLHLVAFVGDASGDGVYLNNDSTLLRRVNIQVDAGFAAYPLVDPTVVGDIDGSGFVPSDAGFQVLEASVVLPTRTLAIPAIPPGVHFSIISDSVDPSVSIPAALSAGADGTVTVPVSIDDAHPEGSTGLLAGHLALTYNPRQFTVSAADVHLGSVLTAGSGWSIVPTIDQATGQIAIALSSDTPIISTAGGSLVTIDFHTIGRVSEPSSIALVLSASPNGQYVTTELEDAQGAFILSPGTNGIFAGSSGVVLVPSAVATTQAVTLPVGVVTTTLPAAIGEPENHVLAVAEALTLTPATTTTETADEDGSALAPAPMHVSMAAPHAGAGTTAVAATSPLVASLVFQMTNTPVVNLPISLGVAAWQHLTDQLFQVLTRNDAGLTGPARETLERVLASQLLPAPPANDLDFLDWQEAGSVLDSQGLEAWSAARPPRREQTASSAASVTLTPAAAERVALDQLFAQAADETGLTGEDE
jgi:hypothetical protein